MLPLTTELHDPEEKVFHNAPVSPTLGLMYLEVWYSEKEKFYGADSLTAFEM